MVQFIRETIPMTPAGRVELVIERSEAGKTVGKVWHNKPGTTTNGRAGTMLTEFGGTDPEKALKKAREFAQQNGFQTVMVIDPANLFWPRIKAS